MASMLPEMHNSVRVLAFFLLMRTKLSAHKNPIEWSPPVNEGRKNERNPFQLERLQSMYFVSSFANRVQSSRVKRLFCATKRGPSIHKVILEILDRNIARSTFAVSLLNNDRNCDYCP